MSLRFPEHSPAFFGMCRPCRLETDIIELEVEGEIPPELEGSLYRAGPDPRFPPMLGDDQFIHGDGMVTKLTLQAGHAHFKSRYVRTARFLEEERAGRSLFGAYRNPYTDDPSVKGMDRGTANTTTVMHAGKLLALKEDSRPYELDPITLATRQQWDFYGGITTPYVTAHPRFDPKTGEMLMFGNQAKGLGTHDLCYFAVDKQGRVDREVWFEAPFAGLVHDFVFTENHVIFPIGPAITVRDAVKQGAPYYMWDSSKTAWLGVLPRHGVTKNVRWFKGPPRMAIHYVNAYEEGTRIVIHGLPGDPDAPPMFPPLGAVPGAHWHDPNAGMPQFRGNLTEWTIDLASKAGTFEERIFKSKGFVELGTVDARFAGQKARHCWLIHKDYERPAVDDPFVVASCNLIERYDMSNGEIVDSYFLGAEGAPGEPLFVPRSSDAAEGEGWILVPIHKNYPGSEFHILDALKLAAGPVARIRLPYTPRPQFHGCWVPADRQALIVND